MPDHERLADEVYRVLRPGGFVIAAISQPCFGTPPRKWVYDSDGRKLGLQCGGLFRRRPRRGPGMDVWQRTAGAESRPAEVQGRTIPADAERLAQSDGRPGLSLRSRSGALRR